MSRDLIQTEYGPFAPDVIANLSLIFQVVEQIDAPVDPVTLSLLAAAVALEGSVGTPGQRRLLLQGRERSRRILRLIDGMLDRL